MFECQINQLKNQPSESGYCSLAAKIINSQKTSVVRKLVVVKKTTIEEFLILV
jgi:hypothetical protein